MIMLHGNIGQKDGGKDHGPAFRSCYQGDRSDRNNGFAMERMLDV
jgi:hypothetical protein